MRLGQLPGENAVSNKPKTLRERIREILEEPFKDGWSNTIDSKHSAILLAFEESLPQKQTYDSDWGGMDLDDHKNEAAVYGFNKCLNQIKERIRG